MKILINLLFVIVGVFVAWGGIKEFDSAVNAIELFRGLFWIIVGATFASSALNNDWD